MPRVESVEQAKITVEWMMLETAVSTAFSMSRDKIFTYLDRFGPLGMLASNLINCGVILAKGWLMTKVILSANRSLCEMMDERKASKLASERETMLGMRVVEEGS